MKRILAIDDDAINRQLLDIYLKGDFDYMIVSNARQALEQLVINPFDAVVTDISLEGTEDGVWLANEIRKIDQYKNMPVIAFTAHSAGYFGLNNSAEIFNFIIEKPILKKAFVAKILELFPN